MELFFNRPIINVFYGIILLYAIFCLIQLAKKGKNINDVSTEEHHDTQSDIAIKLSSKFEEDNIDCPIATNYRLNQMNRNVISTINESK